MPRGSDELFILDWIPCSADDDLRPPAGLKSFQRDWFENLKWAMFRNRQMQGYLPVTPDLWKIAGSHRRDYWDANKSEVMIAFKFQKAAGCGEVMFLPALLEVIAEQRKLLKGKRSRAPALQKCGEKCGDPFLSQSSFDFELQKQKTENEKLTAVARPPKSAKLREREELERRSALTRATQKGLRDYKKHPREDWEQPGARGAA